MGFYARHVLPHLINCACGAKALRVERAKIAPQAKGVVLELGFGSGRNLPFYDPSRVTKLYALEPEPGMLTLARKAARRAPFPVEILPHTAEAAPIAPHSLDTILVTFSLCTIPDAASALQAARRGLKPGGNLLFLEHGLAPDAEIRKVQRRIEPIWRHLAGGCRLTRDIPAIVRAGGFRIDALKQAYLPNQPRFAGYVFRGEAAAD